MRSTARGEGFSESDWVDTYSRTAGDGTELVSAPGLIPVRVREEVAHWRRSAGGKTIELWWSMLGLLEVALAARLFLQLTATSSAAGFAQFVDVMSRPFIWPFLHIFVVSQGGNSAFAEDVIIAMAVYALIAWDITLLLMTPIEVPLVMRVDRVVLPRTDRSAAVAPTSAGQPGRTIPPSLLERRLIEEEKIAELSPTDIKFFAVSWEYRYTRGPSDQDEPIRDGICLLAYLHPGIAQDRLHDLLLGGQLPIRIVYGPRLDVPDGFGWAGPPTCVATINDPRDGCELCFYEVELRRSPHVGRAQDRPTWTVHGDLLDQTGRPSAIWRFNQEIPSFPAGQPFRVETLAPAVVHWSADEWQTAHDAQTCDTVLGMHLTDLPTTDLPAGAKVRFTFFWPEANRWEGADFAVEVAGPG